MSAVQAGIQTFREQGLDPLDDFDVNIYGQWESRLRRYNLCSGYYSNTIFSLLDRGSAKHKAERGLYKFTRPNRNPTTRLVDLYVSKVYGGQLDFQDARKGAIPITVADDQLRNAIKQLWKWSNWGTNKGLYVRYGANLGDTVLSVVDDRVRQKVRLEVLHPGKVKTKVCDEVGNIKAITIEYQKWDDETSLGPYLGTRQPLPYIYTQTIDKGWFRTFKNGNPVDKWPNEYGFVPVVIGHHKDMGLGWGANSYHAEIRKIDELMSLASLLHDQMAKAINAVYYGTNLQSGQTLTLANENKDDLPILAAPPDSTITPLVFPLNMADALQIIEALQDEITQALPELSLFQVRENGNLTAPGVQAGYSDAIDRIDEARGNYDDGLVRAQQMAIAIGGYNRYEGFLGYDLNSYDRGDLTHYIGERPVIKDVLSKNDKITALVSISGTEALRLQEMDYDEETIAEVEAKAQTQASQTQQQIPQRVGADSLARLASIHAKLGIADQLGAPATDTTVPMLIPGNPALPAKTNGNGTINNGGSY